MAGGTTAPLGWEPKPTRPHAGAGAARSRSANGRPGGPGGGQDDNEEQRGSWSRKPGVGPGMADLGQSTRDRPPSREGGRRAWRGIGGDIAEISGAHGGGGSGGGRWQEERSRVVT